MGQKVCPTGFRLITKKDQWRSKWFANKQEFGAFLVEDQEIRRFLMKSSLLQGHRFCPTRMPYGRSVTSS